MKCLLLIIVALLFLPAFAEPVQACQCGEYGTPVCAHFWRSDAVFVGRVVDIKPIPRKPDSHYTYVMVYFMVQESFRGVSGARVGVGVAANSMCEPKFKKGKRYLVYASMDDKTNQLFTGMCTGTTSAGGIDETLEELRNISQRRGGETISGQIVANGWENLPGIKVEVTGNDRTHSTMTSKDGSFSLSLPGPGSYKVGVTVPYPVKLMFDLVDDLTLKTTETDSLTTFEYDVVLEKSQCSYAEFKVYGTNPHATATVAGNVLTASGEAVVKGGVELINTVDTGRDYGAAIKNGSFKFEEVAPGEYYLGLNASSEVAAESDAPYARTYYPATGDKREAKTIQVVKGAVIENLTLHVGPRLSERRAAGTIVWKSGRPIENGYLNVYAGDKQVRTVWIKVGGTFDCILYGDFDYSIEARDFTEEIEGRSQRIKIPPGYSPDLRLVLQRVKK